MLRRMRFWLAWYLPLFGLWLLFVDTLAAQELVLGAIAAAAAATAADVVRSQDLVRFRMRARWLRGLGVLPAQVMTDSWLLAVALWRQLRRPGSVRGLFRVLPFPVEGDDAAAAARRALVTGVVSLTPNTYVVGVERGEGAMLVHQLVRRHGGEVPNGMLEQ
ncbi:MAG TPA: Na+/H+ antiporter subunit E [Actinomycetota bacterium]|nr:Na+/H+ antiporter subunit E [Actinomycetota bacterium]